MDRDQWHEIMAVLGRNKLRTFLTGFGVFWGIFMLVIMMGSAKGLENGFAANFAGSVTNSVFMWVQQTSMSYKGFQRGRSIHLRTADVEAIKKEVPEVEIIAPRCQSGGYRGANNITRGVKVGAFTISGDAPEFQKIQPMNMLEGRFINQRDIDEKRKICVIGREVYNTLYSKGEDVMGTYIRASGVNYKVVGLFGSKSDNAHRAENQEKSIHIPLSTFQQAYNYGDRVDWLSLTSRADVAATLMEEKVKDLLKERHKIHPDDERAFGSFNLEEAFKRMTGLTTGISILSLVVGSLTLLAGAIGVSNIMLVIVKERTREFGVRRAIGAKPAVVIKQVMLESIVLTVTAGVLGIIVGVWLLEVVAGLMNSFAEQDGFFRNPGVELPIVLTALLILIVAGLLAGLIPAKRAVEVKPVDALRYE